MEGLLVGRADGRTAGEEEEQQQQEEAEEHNQTAQQHDERDPNSSNSNVEVQQIKALLRRNFIVSLRMKLKNSLRVLFACCCLCFQSSTKMCRPSFLLLLSCCTPTAILRYCCVLLSLLYRCCVQEILRFLL